MELEHEVGRDAAVRYCLRAPEYPCVHRVGCCVLRGKAQAECCGIEQCMGQREWRVVD